MSLSTVDSPAPNPNPRSRRRVTRVNYAEDVSIDDIPQPPTSSSLDSIPKKPKHPDSTNKTATNSASASHPTSNSAASLSTSFSSSSNIQNQSSASGTRKSAKSSSSTSLSSAAVKPSATLVLSTSQKRERDASETDIVPMNWQPPQETSDVFGNMIDLHNAYVGEDGCLHLSDGTLYSPEGMRNFFFNLSATFYHLILLSFLLTLLIILLFYSFRSHISCFRTSRRAILHCSFNGVCVFSH